MTKEKMTMTRNTIRLSELLSFLMYSEEIETVDFYNDAMNFMYSFPIQEIPYETTAIKKFNIYKTDTGKSVLEIVEV